MKIEEIKYSNFIRLCEKYGANEPKELMRILNASKQHASQLLSGKSSLGPGTIEKLCAAWNIEEDEFIYLSESTVDEKKDRLYKQENSDTHERVEAILNCGKEETIAAFNAGLKGVYNSMFQDELVARIKSLEEKIERKLTGNTSSMVTILPEKKSSNVK